MVRSATVGNALPDYRILLQNQTAMASQNTAQPGQSRPSRTIVPLSLLGGLPTDAPIAGQPGQGIAGYMILQPRNGQGFDTGMATDNSLTDKTNTASNATGKPTEKSAFQPLLQQQQDLLRSGNLSDLERLQRQLAGLGTEQGLQTDGLLVGPKTVSDLKSRMSQYIDLLNQRDRVAEKGKDDKKLKTLDAQIALLESELGAAAPRLAASRTVS